MKLKHTNADLFVPDGLAPDLALPRTTHLGIGAHQDDLEIIAYEGIEACHGRDDRWFGGVVLTDGSGSARTGVYADYTGEEMRHVRMHEQRKAATIGDYSFMAQLGYPSKAVRSPDASDPVDDLEAILRAARPATVYVHNPADKHDTHIGTLARCLDALRRLPESERPERLLGVEVWRDLDWLLDDEKVVLQTDRRPNLAAALMGVFDSQISGGKRYDLAVPGRRLANATFFQSHSVDESESAAFAVDLSPLLRDDGPTVAALIEGHMDRFREDVLKRIAKMIG